MKRAVIGLDSGFFYFYVLFFVNQELQNILSTSIVYGVTVPTKLTSLTSPSVEEEHGWTDRSEAWSIMLLLLLFDKPFICVLLGLDLIVTTAMRDCYWIPDSNKVFIVCCTVPHTNQCLQSPAGRHFASVNTSVQMFFWNAQSSWFHSRWQSQIKYSFPKLLVCFKPVHLRYFHKIYYINCIVMNNCLTYCTVHITCIKKKSISEMNHFKVMWLLLGCKVEEGFNSCVCWN